MDKTTKPIKISISYRGDDLRFSSIVLDAPLSVCFKVTNRCVFTCPHCCANSKASEVDLSYDEIVRILDMLQGAGVPKINISGGEPFHHSDIIDILAYAKRCLGLEVSITTSGAANKKQVVLMKELGIVPDLSLDSHLEEINDQLRFRGAFRIASQFISLCNDMHVPFIVNSTIQRRNFDEVDKFIEFCSSIGCRGVRMLPLRPQGRGIALHRTEGLSEAEISSLCLFVESKVWDFPVDLLDLKKYPSSLVLIEADGSVISQSYSEFVVAGVLSNTASDFESIWRRSGAFDHNMHLMRYIGRARNTERVTPSK